MHHQVDKDLIRATIDALVAGGFPLFYVYDGGEHVPCATADEALDAVYAVDTSRVHFKDPAEPKRTVWFMVVLGNEAGVPIADYTDREPFGSIVLRVQDEFDNTHCQAPGCYKPLDVHGQCDNLFDPDHWMMREG